MATTKKMDLLTAVEQIVEKAKDSKLGAEFYREANIYIEYVVCANEGKFNIFLRPLQPFGVSSDLLRAKIIIVIKYESLSICTFECTFPGSDKAAKKLKVKVT